MHLGRQAPSADSVRRQEGRIPFDAIADNTR
jgi:hypothetical protein